MSSYDVLLKKVKGSTTKFNDIYANLVAALKEKANPYFWIYQINLTPTKLVCDIGGSHLVFPKEFVSDLFKNASDTERPGDIACYWGDKWIYLPSTLKSKQKKIENKQ